MLGRIVRGFLILVVVLVLLVGALFAGARFHDGPLGPIPGGPLTAGELVTAPQSDWSFAKDLQEIEMQLAYENTSRTTWIFVKDGAAYIPCSLKFPPGKRWYKAADKDGAALLRIGGKRYPVTMTRVQDEKQRADLGQVVSQKYPAAARSGNTLADSWFFKLDSRADSAGAAP